MMAKTEGETLGDDSMYAMRRTRSPYARTLSQSSAFGALAYITVSQQCLENENSKLRPTKPSPGRRALFMMLLGNNEISGRSESSSLQSTFIAGSHISLQVRANRDRERRPLGDSTMVSRSFFVASGSRNRAGNMSGREQNTDDWKLIILFRLLGSKDMWLKCRRTRNWKQGQEVK